MPMRGDRLLVSLRGSFTAACTQNPYVLADSLADYLARFVIGSSLVVRVKPGAPEVSLLCQEDQGEPMRVRA